MGKQIPITTSFHLPDGREVTLETGKLAAQADGAVLVRMGDTMLLATAVSSREAKEGQSFFPLSVDYQEKFAAAGRIPGNFFRREGRITDAEILVSRLVDRAIRPLFPDHYLNETQILISLLSCGKDDCPDALAGLAASAALTCSDIPLEQPISEVRVARCNGKFIVNPSRSELEHADIELMVGATGHDVLMVEGDAKECSEADLVAAILIGKDAIKTQVDAQLKLAELAGKTVKRHVEPMLEDENLLEFIKANVAPKIYAVAKAGTDKNTRRDGFDAAKTEMNEALVAHFGEDHIKANKEIISRYYKKVQKTAVREVMLTERIRLDGRKMDEIRPIWSEISYLPTTHGSSVFTRGETQSLGMLTLGTKLDEQMVDNAMQMSFSRFILHYNFPAFSTGEVKPNRGPGRREVGHANLAHRSLRQVLPSHEEFPYTLRFVSDILESNGSSSMATVCSGSLAMMDAGVPIKSHVSGIAMGMVTDGDRYAILSDILGDEDHLGDMDFKVTGTAKGICAVQMDMKIDGLSPDRMREALEQARHGRMHILDKLTETIAVPRADLKPHAPRMVRIEVKKEYIGAIIGPGGKVIQEIQRETGATINIEEVDNRGIVTIASTNGDALAAAKARIMAIAYEPEEGDDFDAKVASIQPYGAFVDFLPGKSGLLHISEISHERLNSLDGVLKEGDTIKVRIVGIDPKTGKYRLSHKVFLEKTEGKK